MKNYSNFCVRSAEGRDNSYTVSYKSLVLCVVHTSLPSVERMQKIKRGDFYEKNIIDDYAIRGNKHDYTDEHYGKR